MAIIRSRIFITLAIILTLQAIVLLRRHFHELGEVARTYSTFHNLVQQHQGLLYRYPEPANKEKTVPRILHNIALGDANTVKYQEAINSCRKLHPDWKYMLWGDDNATSFMSEYYPEILPHYKRYPQNIQRANVLRYALLHKLGGVYLDLDVTCHVALDSTPLITLPFVSPGAHPAGVNNAFIATHSGHPFLTQLLKSVPSHDMHWGLPMRIPYVENMMSTGCMYFSNEWMVYVRELLAGRQKEKVFILADEKGQLGPHMLRGKVTTPIFSHGGASSWHSWDAVMFLVIGQHYLLFIFFLLSVLMLAVALPIYLRKRSRTRPQRRMCDVLSLVGYGWRQERKLKTDWVDMEG